MKCREIREQLPDLAAGLIAAEPETNDHLSSCATCAETLADFRKTMAVLDEWQVPEPSAYFDTRLRARLRDEAAKQQKHWFAWLRRPALTAAMAVIAIGVFLLERGGIEPSRPVQPDTALSDLQTLDKNQNLFADPDPDSASSLLDVLEIQENVSSNP